MAITVRKAAEADLPRVNELRKTVNDLHVQGRPDFFRAGAWPAIEGQAALFLTAPEHAVLVAEIDGEIAGFAMVSVIRRPENPYMQARDFYHVEEFGVDARFRRQGAATALVDAMRRDAAALGLTRIELDMWAFNEGALAFYEQAGFTTYRRYMELSVD